MRVGIDARMFGLKHAGIGRYVENLVKELSQSKSLEIVMIKSAIPHYSLAEQILMPGVIRRAKLDLVHFPHFNVPIFYRGKYVVTIHDLIKHSFRGMETTTRNPWLYWFKYLGYKFVFRRAVERAARILVPSQAVKNELIKSYHLLEGKVVVTYEGVDEKFQHSAFSLQPSAEILSKYKISRPFVIYTGSLYPHKNIERLIQAIKLLNCSRITLVISCARSIFWERLKEKIKELEAEKWVKLVGFVPDEELRVLYTQTEAFVFPTLSEGFGLPGLEAMACGCPVVCSDIPVLREIYGDAAVYFNPLDPKDIAQKIQVVCSYDSNHRNKMVERGLGQVKKYSWQKMAQETLEVYRQAISSPQVQT